ncbi:Uma2 family endonuclease [Spirulina major CS-329]|uniref:Uma2 family endonuclease n=1 Tax=Spirulina TaxID=1154 RepID=UPI00232A811C|nr:MULTISPECIES: Uma2 family endonuclease [Spirulina]MDB9495499.1 Uma2 family endonuclease [Spirulina subsalsa CS-330]MDB9505150.1 Uma2 family endonuclease [Spirulina major CS-329]
MIANPQDLQLSAADYLAHEQDSPIKHEYRAGEIYAMAGASEAHVTIAGNIFALLRSHVRGSGCRVYMADMKTRIDAKNCYYYPDVVVTCDERDRALKQFKQYPCLIIEVLSPGTEAFDRGDKFFDYQHLATLQEYVVISQTHPRVNVFRRDRSGLWTLQFYEPDTPIHLHSIDFTINFNQLYEDVVFEEPNTAEPPTE